MTGLLEEALRRGEAFSPDEQDATHAMLGVLAHTGARVGAVAKLRLSDYCKHRVLRFRETNCTDREIPVRGLARCIHRRG